MSRKGNWSADKTRQEKNSNIQKEKKNTICN